MRKLTKIMLCVSALFSLICMGMSIYVGVVFHDITWYLVALLFALATVWLSIIRMAKSCPHGQKLSTTERNRSSVCDG